MSRSFHEAQHDLFASTVSFALPHLSRSTFRSYKIGDLSTHVASRLLRTAGAFHSLMRRARLVNVKAWRNQFSYGRIDPTVHPATNQLVFTFAIGRPSVFPQADDVSLVKRALSNHVVVYGTRDNPVQYISVGINSVECAAFGITNFQPRSLRYLYMAAGVVFRSILARHTKPDVSPGAFAERHENLFSLNVSQRPLNMVFNLPYEVWALHRSVWKICPNLISRNCINPWSAGYLSTLYRDLRVDFKDAGYDTIWEDEDATLFSHVKTSAMSFIQAINVGDYTDPDAQELIFPAILFASLHGLKPATGQEAEQVYLQALLEFGGAREKFGDLFNPVDAVIRGIMRNDSHVVSKFKALAKSTY